MQLSRADASTVLIEHLDQFLTELLRRISASADPSDSEAAQARLYSAPSHDAAAEEGLLEDWQEYVTPELEKLFLSNLELIDRDLEGLQFDPKSDESRLTIPFNHLDAWVHGLTQARLAIAARYGFDEEDSDRSLPMIGDPRSFALFQMRFYGVLEELFLHELEAG